MLDGPDEKKKEEEEEEKIEAKERCPYARKPVLRRKWGSLHQMTLLGENRLVKLRCGGYARASNCHWSGLSLKVSIENTKACTKESRMLRVRILGQMIDVLGGTLLYEL